MCTYSIRDLCLCVKGNVQAQLACGSFESRGGATVACYTFLMRPITTSRQRQTIDRRASGVKRQYPIVVLLDMSLAPRWSPGCPSNAG